MTAARALGVYAVLLVVIRLLGKRTVGNFTAFDLLVALMLGEVVDEIIYGDVTFAQGAVAIGVVAAAQFSNAWLSCRRHGADRVLEGVPTRIVDNGEFDRAGMRRERMSESDVMAAMRLQGIDDLRDVRLAMVEVDGLVSVLKQPWAETVEKADLGGEAAGQKRAGTQGIDEAPEEKRTDAERYTGGSS